MSGNGKRTSAVVAQKVCAAEGVAGQRIARAEARPVEAADRLAALVEEVEQPHVLATPALDVAADRPTDQGDLLRYRIVGAAFALVRTYWTSPPRPANSAPACRK